MNSAAVVMGSNENTCQTKGGCGCRAGRPTSMSAAYLGLLTLTAWGVQIPMLLFAVPKFAEFLRDFGVQVPQVTKMVFDWSAWMQAPVVGNFLPGAAIYGAAVALLALVAFALAKAGGRFGKALVVLIALLGGAIACGQAAAVLFPTLSAQRAIEAAKP